MDDYLDIRLRPDPEFTSSLLMSALFSKLHRGLVESRLNSLGVSFPCHDADQPSLGDCLRLHGKQSEIEQIMALNWLSGMQDHVHAMPIKPVPQTASHRIVQRVQAKSSAERLRRRAVKRHGLDDAQVLERIPDKVERRVALPFVSIQSRSTGQRFRLFIKHGELQDSPSAGFFSSYGLSQHTTIPWF